MVYLNYIELFQHELFEDKTFQHEKFAICAWCDETLMISYCLGSLDSRQIGITGKFAHTTSLPLQAHPVCLAHFHIRQEQRWLARFFAILLGTYG